MKQYEVTSTNLVTACLTNANLWTIANSDVEQPILNNWYFEFETTALDFDGSRFTAKGSDSEQITQVSPDYKAYFEEGCEVAFISESTTSAKQSEIVSALQNELSDYTYFVYMFSSKYYVLGFGTSNVTRTQFYDPVLSTHADVKNLILWD